MSEDQLKLLKELLNKKELSEDEKNDLQDLKNIAKEKEININDLIEKEEEKEEEKEIKKPDGSNTFEKNIEELVAWTRKQGNQEKENPNQVSKIPVPQEPLTNKQLEKVEETPPVEEKQIHQKPKKKNWIVESLQKIWRG